MHRVASMLLLILGLAPLPAGAETALTMPADIRAGGQLIVEIDGEINRRDFITIVPVNTPEGEYDAYQYTRTATVELRAPEIAGDYEVRYLGAEPPYPTLMRRALKVTPVTATLETPTRVDAGTKFRVAWTGPDNLRDFIGLVDPNDRPNRWVTYAYTKKGNPVELVAPDLPGTYLVRYLTGQKYHTLAEAEVVVAATAATVEAPAEVVVGGTFDVKWSGPDNPQDFVAISPRGSDVRKYAHYRYTRKGSPATLRAPDAPGEFEVRYQTGQSYTILAAQPVAVVDAPASLEGPDQVLGGTEFDVTWTGPDNPGDYLAVTEFDATRQVVPGSRYAYTRRGNPARLRAPPTPGTYELRYQTGQSARVLARRQLIVTPPPVAPGHFTVTVDPAANRFAAGDAVEIILDASGSMLKRQDGKRRIAIARDVLLSLIGEVIPTDTPFALRVFGHRQANACDTDLEIPLAPLDVATTETRIRALTAKNLAKTPIARSLALVREDLATAAGERIVILVTDGEETCDGDPADAIESLRATGTDVRVNIVGFAIDDETLKTQFRYWADLGGGGYYDAADADDLQRSLDHALQAPYRVIDADGNPIARGTIGDDGLQLVPGEYQVRSDSTPPLSGTATVVSGKKTVVYLR